MDIGDLLVDGLRPIGRLILLVLRFLIESIAEGLVDFVVWPLGWACCRLLTLNHFPSVGVGQEHLAAGWVKVTVNLVGILSLAAMVLALVLLAE